MEKDTTNKELDRLIKAWTDESLTAEPDSEAADRLIGFIENDIDIEELLEEHIHQLAAKEKVQGKRNKRRRIKIATVSTAASLAFILSAAMFILRENTSTISDPELKESLMAYQAVTESKSTVAISSVEELTINEESPENGIKEKVKKSSSKVSTKPNSEEAELMITENATEAEIAKALSEIDLSFESLFGNSLEDVSINCACIIPKSLFSTDDYTIDASALNKFETNLISALHDMKSLNIKLEF